MIVQLSSSELLQAADIGIRRRVRALHRGRADRHGQPHANEWGVDIEAAAAEMALAKALGIYWADSPELDLAGDVGRYHVRSTALEHGSLILYDSDPDGACFVLVVGAEGRYRIAGWLSAAEGKHERWWQTEKTRVPCFLVPQSALQAGLPGALERVAA